MGSAHDDALWYSQQAKRLAHAAREAAFEQWWNLSTHNGTLPSNKKNLAREAYYAAWGGGALSAGQSGAQQSKDQ